MAEDQEDNGKQVYCRPGDARRLKTLADLERRAPSYQLSKILDEAYETRGLNPDGSKAVPAGG